MLVKNWIGNFQMNCILIHILCWLWKTFIKIHLLPKFRGQFQMLIVGK